MIEDTMAVDTGIGKSYRKAVNERYEASAMLRTILHQLNLFWETSALVQ